MKVCGTLPDEKPWPAEGLAEGKGDMEWVVEEGNYKYQLWSRDQLQKGGLLTVMSISSLFCYEYVPYIYICLSI